MLNRAINSFNRSTLNLTRFRRVIKDENSCPSCSSQSQPNTCTITFKVRRLPARQERFQCDTRCRCITKVPGTTWHDVSKNWDRKAPVFRSHVALITFTYDSVPCVESTCTLIHASWAYPKSRSKLRSHHAFTNGGKLFRCNWLVSFIRLFCFCMLTIPWVWMDCLFCSFQICSLYVLLVFKRSALMLTNCIHRYVLFIARLKGIYTYYEEEKKSVQISYPVNMEVHCLRLLQTDTRHCSMTVYIDLTRMKKNHTHSRLTDSFSIISSVAYLSDLFIFCF